MAYVKHVSVHKYPQSFIRYIMNGDKTSEMKLVTGLNCTPDEKAATSEFAKVFEQYSNERFCKQALNENVKRQKIRLHHYIQSFAPGEVSAEEAHRIGVEWAREVFGEKHQVMVATHIDRGHIHNHFAVAAYDLEGKVWHDNMKTLYRCRDISDKIVKAHGLSVIQNHKRGAGMNYGEWLARKNGTSWKVKLCDDIDRLILQDNVKSVDELVEQLQENGYIVTCGKYISVKAPGRKHAVRTFRLGDGYGVEDLQYRIENKDREMPLSEVMKYEGIQREYALCLRQLQILVYRKIENPVQASYGMLRKSAELLTFICENKIHSAAELEDMVNAAADKVDKLREKKKSLESDIEKIQKALSVADRFVELNSKDMPTPKEMKELREMKKSLPAGMTDTSGIEEYKGRLAQLKTELADIDDNIKSAEETKKEYGNYYSTYLQQAQSDYDFIRERVKREQEEMERAAELAERQNRQEEIGRRNNYYR